MKEPSTKRSYVLSLICQWGAARVSDYAEVQLNWDVSQGNLIDSLPVRSSVSIDHSPSRIAVYRAAAHTVRIVSFVPGSMPSWALHSTDSFISLCQSASWLVIWMPALRCSALTFQHLCRVPQMCTKRNLLERPRWGC